MSCVGLTKSELETKKYFFEGHLTTLNNIDLVDSAGKIDETARKKLFQEVSDVFPSYLAYTELGITIFNNSWNYPWKLWTYIPGWNPASKSFDIQTYYKIGEAEAQKDSKLLYNQLKEGYKDRLTEIDLSLKQIRLQELREQIVSLDKDIGSDLIKGHTTKGKVDQMASLIKEVDAIEALLKKHKIVVPYK